jgi:AraC family transcriptional regulator, positive regulator of tynA and feaB
MRPLSVCGLLTVSLSGNPQRIVRTRRDIRADGIDDFHALFTLEGRSTVVQRDQAFELGAGDIMLLDKAQPALLSLSDHTNGKWFCLRVPRRDFVTHLGFEPQSGLRAQSHTLAGRLLTELIREAMQGEEHAASVTEPYMQLAVYDLLGTLFRKTDPLCVNAHNDKLFARVCNIIRASFTDPELGPCQVASEARVSLRYLQKLFTARGTTCTHFIQALRLDHALQLIQRRHVLQTRRPLAQIAWDSGFRDYNHFARGFRRRFGYAPGSAGCEP